MNEKNQPHDDQLQAKADVTWHTLESGDRLGQAIKDSIESEMPPANPQLRDVLADRLSERLADRTSNESPVTRVTKESKLPGQQPGTRRPQWLMALSLILLLGALCWWAITPQIQRSLVSDQVSLRQQQSNLATANSQDSLKNIESGFGTENQIGGINVGPDGSTTEPASRGSARSGTIENLNPPMISLGGGGNGRINESHDQANESRRVRLSRGLKSEQAQANNRPQLKDRRSKLGLGGEQMNQGQMGRSGKGYAELSRKALDTQGRYGFGETPADAYYEKPVVGDFAADWKSRSQDEQSGGESYNQIYENEFLQTRGEQAISTFSIDVDTASYSNMRRFLNAGQRPPRNSVRIEELINYFSYDYPQPEGDVPFSVNMEIASCPWNTEHQLLRVGLKGKEIHRDERPVSNLVFLLDVSGSMNSQDKLSLLKRGLRMMIDQLNENDLISIVTYAGNAGVVLEPTSGDQKAKIHEAIERLSSGGSTHGSAGIEKAYNLATLNFIEEGVNRVIWATDGDLNVGITDDQTLINLVAERAKEGVFLTTLGFGTGNLKDSKLEQIANHGNGIYAYIDSMREARKVLVEQMSGSLVTIAKDVKLQIEFNPAEVAAYRLIGYENRMLKTEDFDNDAKDAGEIGAGHTVTALYEIVPVGGVTTKTGSSPTKLKYQTSASDTLTQEDQATAELTEAAGSGEVLNLALRYKLPDENESTRIDFTLEDSDRSFDEASSDFRFAASVAGFGMLLRDSRFRGNVSTDMIQQIASSALGGDNRGYRAEFLDLVRQVR